MIVFRCTVEIVSVDIGVQIPLDLVILLGSLVYILWWYISSPSVVGLLLLVMSRGLASLSGCLPLLVNLIVMNCVVLFTGAEVVWDQSDIVHSCGRSELVLAFA